MSCHRDQGASFFILTQLQASMLPGLAPRNPPSPTLTPPPPPPALCPLFWFSCLLINTYSCLSSLNLSLFCFFINAPSLLFFSLFLSHVLFLSVVLVSIPTSPFINLFEFLVIHPSTDLWKWLSFYISIYPD